MIELKHTITRQTAHIDYRTRKPLVIQLVEGGHHVRIKEKGCRKWFTVTYQQIFKLGAENEAAAIRQARIEKRKLAKRLGAKR